MILSARFLIPFLLILVLSLVVRTCRLDLRPMHTDEAVHAVKFGNLLEKGEYRYDPFEYHGPTLNYLSLIPVWLQGKKTVTTVNEKDLRLIPALAGTGLVLLLLLMYPGLDRGTLILAALLASLSPILVFYSRYYIQEILLLFFSYGFIVSVYRYGRKPGWLWAASAGLFLALMYATKETFILSLAAMAAALLLLNFNPRNGRLQLPYRPPAGHMILLLLVALVVGFSFFSSFFTHFEGIPDSVRTYTTYLDRATENEVHRHPWYYYLEVLGWTRGPQHLVWSSLFILVLAFAGMLQLILDRSSRSPLLVFIALYSAILFLVYTFVPYKTPWNALQFHFGWVFLAATGLRWLIRHMKSPVRQAILYFLVFFGLSFHILQMYGANFILPAHPSNPFVYGHTSPDIYRIDKHIDYVAAIHPDGKNMYIEVIAPGHDYWPLPWYLREYQRVGYTDQVPLERPPAPLILIFPELEEELAVRLYEKQPPGHRHLYMPLFEEYTTLRPGVEIRAYLQKKWHDGLLRKKSEGNPEEPADMD